MSTQRQTGRGRPRLIEGELLKRVTVTLPASYIAWAKQEGDGNTSEGLRRLLEDLDQRQGAALAG